MCRRISREIKIGKLKLGGGSPILVQSMTNTDTRDIAATVAQIKRLEQAGCELVRVAVLNMDAASCLGKIKSQIDIPLVADIHFDYRLALRAIEEGVDKLRLNPGNITERSKIEKVVKAAKDKGIPIRVGVNSGSLPRDLLIKYEGVTAEAMVESALREIAILEESGFYDIVVSLKSTDVRTMIEAYRMIAAKVDYPLHLGVTEAGLGDSGIVKSAIGIGTLLQEGLGDTIRVSLTGDPVQEVKVAYEILRALGLRRRGIEFRSCPTCGRTGIDLEKIAKEIEERLAGVKLPLNVALMGCAVNGPGEAKEADIGLVGGIGDGMLYVNGKIIKRVKEEEIVDELVRLVLNYHEN